MQNFAAEQMLNVGFKLVPEIALGEPQEIPCSESPRSRLRKVFSPRMAGIDHHSAAYRGHDVGKSYVVAAWSFQHQSADECVLGSLPYIVAVRLLISQIFV